MDPALLPALACQAVLREAQHRGIDLEKWFGAENVPGGDFEKKMMGLGLGVAAGLPAEAAQGVERGLSREALDEAKAAAAGDGGVDIATLLRLAGVDTTRPSPRRAFLRKGGETLRPRTPAAPASRKEALALAATELERQKVTPSRLRGVKVALRRAGPTIDGDALQKALATQNLRLRDAHAAALIREAAWRAANEEKGAPTSAPLASVLALLEDLFAPTTKAPVPYEAWKRNKEEARKGRTRIQFRRALGGLSHALEAQELKDMLLKYQVLNEECLTEEVRASAKEWARSPDGHFAQLKAGLKHDTGDIEVERRKVLREMEKADGSVTLQTWARYETCLKRRDACEGVLPFEAWLATIKNERQKADAIVAEWTKEKNDQDKRRQEDRRKTAPVDRVVGEMRALYDAAHTEVDGCYKPTRICSNMEAKLRGFSERATNGLVTKAQFDETFGKETFSLLADKKVAPKALALADAGVRQAFAKRSGRDEPPVSEVFGMSGEAAAAHAQARSAKKENEVGAEYVKWVAAKADLRKALKAKAKTKAKKLKQGLDATRSDVEATLGAWRKAQAKAARCARKRAAYAGDDMDTITTLDAAVEAANAARAEKGLEAAAASQRWRALKSNVSKVR